jgi:hypothetical protein
MGNWQEVRVNLRHNFAYNLFHFYLLILKSDPGDFFIEVLGGE